MSCEFVFACYYTTLKEKAEILNLTLDFVKNLSHGFGADDRRKRNGAGTVFVAGRRFLLSGDEE